MRINVDRDRLAGYRLTPQDIENALRRQNLELPSGRIESAKREFRSLRRPTSARSSSLRTDCRHRKGLPGEAARRGRCDVGAVNERVIARYKGEPSINMGLVKQATGNPLELSKALRAGDRQDQSRRCRRG